MYDLIGDIHGHADELIQLLRILGYETRHGIFRHPERKVIFLGDFIDRGPQIRQTLEIVRPMVESGSALAVMGNHELNALAYHTEDVEAAGEFIRRRNPTNERQHIKTMQQLNSEELATYLNWFRTLPMWLDLDGLRAVHACWDDHSIDQIARTLTRGNGVSNEFLQLGCRPGKSMFSPVEIVLKGKEAVLPDGFFFHDKDGHVRTATRVRWYLSPKEQTYRTYSLTDEIACDFPIEQAVIEAAAPYPLNAKPVFVGHYWMTASHPELLAPNIACLDYSVARGGFLCAYRWNGEQTLCNNNFVW
jgi:hypothetical protein